MRRKDKEREERTRKEEKLVGSREQYIGPRLFRRRGLKNAHYY